MSTQDTNNWALEVNVDDAGTFNTIQGPISTSFIPGTGFVSTQVAVADFEGLGRSSIVALVNDPPVEVAWRYWTNTAAPGGYVFTSQDTSTTGLNLGANGVNVKDYAAYAADFNGDGKADILFDSIDDTTGQSTALDRELAVNQGGGKFILQPLRLPVGVGPAVVTIADFNGDGIPDLIFNPLVPGTTTNQTTGQLIVLLGNGDGTFTQVSANQPAVFSDGTTLAGYEVVAGNFSGTGRADLLVEKESSIGISTGVFVLFTANGDGTFSQVGAIPSSGTSFANGARPVVGDFRGVGHDSILWDTVDPTTIGETHPQSTGADAILLAQPGAPDLLNQITSGLGARTNIAYAPLSSGGQFYAKDTVGAVSYPTVSLQTAQPAVGAVHVSDGVGGTHSVTYNYSGLRADLQGRGSLGFSQVVSTDQSTAIMNATNFNQTFPQIGLPVAGTTKIPSNGTVITLNSTVILYQNEVEVAGTPAVNFVGQTNTQVMRNDLDGTSFPTANTASAMIASPRRNRALAM